MEHSRQWIDQTIIDNALAKQANYYLTMEMHLADTTQEFPEWRINSNIIGIRNNARRILARHARTTAYIHPDTLAVLREDIKFRTSHESNTLDIGTHNA